MDSKTSLLDMGFKNLSNEEKRAAFVVMDMMLKKLHEKGLMVTDFNPNNIYLQDGIYIFKNTMPISSVVADNKEEAILNNLIWMSVVALWAYQPNSSYNLLAPSFVSQNFDSFMFWYPEEDRTYYRTILVDSYHSKKLVNDNPYFTDYVLKQHRNQSNNSGKGTSLAYIKATQAGKAFANREEAAFGYHFFMVTVVAALSVILIGFVFFFYNYLS